MPSILMISNGFSVDAVYSNVCQELAAQLAAQNWRVITTSTSKNRYLRPIAMALTTLFQQKHYDLAQIDVFSGSAFRWAELTSRILSYLQKPFILTLHGGNLPEFSQRHPERVSAVLKRATVVTCPSAYMWEQMQVYRQDLLLLPNPISLNNYTFQQRLQARPALIWLRAFAEIYNPDLAAHTVQALVMDFPEIRLIMVGPDKGDGAFEKFQHNVATLQLDEQIAIVGAIPKSSVPQQLQQGDIFLNTTNVDNTPISVLEALASGLCIVSTNVGGIPYLLEHEKDALLVPPDDAEAMANAVRRILSEEGLAERLSGNARAKAEQFDWALILAQWQHLLAETIKRGQHG